MSSQPIQLTRRPQKPAAKERLVRRAKLLAWLGVGWHGIEAAIAIVAGLAASSIALIGFGADSLIESAAGIILLWRFAASRAASEDAERRAQKLRAMSFYVLAAYVGFEPEGGPIRLRVLGPEGAKQIAAEMVAGRVTKQLARHH